MGLPIRLSVYPPSALSRGDGGDGGIETRLLDPFAKSLGLSAGLFLGHSL